jgi:hypothetical protein
MPTEFCPQCRTARTGAFRYCRSCGFDFDAASIPAAPAWPDPGVFGRPPAATPTPTVGAGAWPAPNAAPARKSNIAGIIIGLIAVVLLLGGGALMVTRARVADILNDVASAMPTVRPTAEPVAILGLGVARATARSTWESDSNGGFAFEDAPLADGRERLLGRSADRLVNLELIGPAASLTEITVSTPSAQAGVIASVLSFYAPDATQWVLAQFDVVATTNADIDVERTFGGVKVRVITAFETLGIVTVVISST